jgi:NAD(P)-dependent dehydrogenase (short-subunit alcohol dehydrogenase family)
MTRLLEGKVALVTGAGHGIGRGHALELARQGAKVVVNDLGGGVHGGGAGRDAEVVVDIIKARGGEAVADFGDVSNEAAADAMVQRGLDEWGQIDIIVNNAGIARDKAIWNMTVEDFDMVMNVHLKGTWLTCRAASRIWRAAAKAGSGRYPGRVINTTSGAGLLGHFGQSNYATAKSAIAGLTLTLSLELASIGATANMISPAGLTRITATIGVGEPKEADEFDPEGFDRLDPSLASPIVAWLASDESQMVTGQCIRAVGDELAVLKPWHVGGSTSSGGKRWKTEEIGKVIATELFGTRAPGLRLGG